MVAPAAVDLEIALRDALVLEAAFLEHPARGGVLGQAGGLDPEMSIGEGVVDERRDRLAHVALAREGFADPVAERARLRRAAADVVERDRPQKRLVRAPDEEHRHRGALRDRPLRPVDAVREGLAREVVGGPGRLPRDEEARARLAQGGPGAVVAMGRRAQGHPFGLDRDRPAAEKHQAASLAFSASAEGAFDTGP
jgi:hypothetical protein